MALTPAYFRLITSVLYLPFSRLQASDMMFWFVELNTEVLLWYRRVNRAKCNSDVRQHKNAPRGSWVQVGLGET